MTTKYEDMLAEQEETEEETEEETVEPDDDDEAQEEEEPVEEEDVALEGVDTKALEREMARHEKQMVKVLGPSFPDMAPCPTCEGMGFTPEALTGPPDFPQDPSRETCPVCQGYGTTKTGAKDPGQTTLACSQCQGLGWRSIAQEAPAIPAPGYPSGNSASVFGPIAPAPEDLAAIAELRKKGYVVGDVPLAPAAVAP